jgi:hypothetical protein
VPRSSSATTSHATASAERNLARHVEAAPQLRLAVPWPCHGPSRPQPPQFAAPGSSHRSCPGQLRQDLTSCTKDLAAVPGSSHRLRPGCLGRTRKGKNQK